MKNISMQPIWDADYVKKCEQAALEQAKKAQFAEDRERAMSEAIRYMSNSVGHHFVCRSARCRRARRCVSNQASCTLVFGSKLEPDEMKRLVGKAYLLIQQERRAAAHRAVKSRRHCAGVEQPRRRPAKAEA